MGMTDTGRRLMLDRLIGVAGTVLDAANAHIGVGGGAGATTAFAAAQTDLQGATKFREIVDSAPSRATDTLTLIATLEAADANQIIEEVGAFNAASAGIMVSRVVTALGTKVSPAVWTITLTLQVTNT